jgi:hypothetical protein
MNYSITQNGKPLSPDKYIWDAATKTLATTENDLVLDFGDVDRVTFRTGSNCTFNTGSFCTFGTGSFCTFNTGSYCTFKTGSSCTFNTGSDCTFGTGSYCTFNTGSDCTFNTGSDCTFSTGFDCTFKTGKNCSLIRYDVDGVTELPVDTTIKLNSYGVAGYTIVKEKKSCEGKSIS